MPTTKSNLLVCYTDIMGKGKLIVASMPIGNNEDFTIRLARWLIECDLLIVEHIKTAAKIFENAEIEYNKNYIEFNNLQTDSDLPYEIRRKSAIDTTLTYLEAGKTVLFTCDQGSPGINDPGSDFIHVIKSAGHDVDILPGPNIVTTAFLHALAMDSNYSGYGFTFLQPHPNIDVIKNSIENLKNANTAIILTIEPFFVSLNVQQALLDILGNRTVLICENMTMHTEEIIKSNIESLHNFFMRGSYISIVIYPS